ncbi:MAG: hypothetical protein DMG07_10400 [Acidobacteria bacterium]|nr:MAG: hypothetical protein DMG07_10400 [Acidobacteriota bacterium]
MVEREPGPPGAAQRRDDGRRRRLDRVQELRGVQSACHRPRARPRARLRQPGAGRDRGVRAAARGARPGSDRGAGAALSEYHRRGAHAAGDGRDLGAARPHAPGRIRRERHRPGRLRRGARRCSRRVAREAARGGRGHFPLRPRDAAPGPARPGTAAVRRGAPARRALRPRPRRRRPLVPDRRPGRRRALFSRQRLDRDGQVEPAAMSVEQLIERATLRPARALRRPDLGSLAEGAAADVAVFEVERGRFGFLDSGHARLTGEQNIRCVLTVRDGAVVWDPDGRTRPDWQQAGPYSNYR